MKRTFVDRAIQRCLGISDNDKKENIQRAALNEAKYKDRYNWKDCSDTKKSLQTKASPVVDVEQPIEDEIDTARNRKLPLTSSSKQAWRRFLWRLTAHHTIHAGQTGHDLAHINEAFKRDIL